MESGATNQLVAGHWASLALLGDTDAVRSTLDLYRSALGTDVYLRLTGNGLTVMSLDVERCRSMISVGPRDRRDDVLRALPPGDDRVAAAAAGYVAKRDGLGRAAVEERFALEQIAAALSDGLRLGDSGWLFLHQEWRLTLPEGPGKIDLLAFDPACRQLVVIECKASARDVPKRDRHGWPAARQADEYAAAIWRARDGLYPFFGELARAMCRVYAPGALPDSFVLDGGLRPATAVWWPGHTPPWPAWDSAELRVAGDDVRVARYRAHQSRYRQDVLGVGPGARPNRPALRVGSTLALADVAVAPSLNFVDAAAYRHAVERAAAVQTEGGTLESDRLFHNLMSSMPMCFNIFGSLGDAPGFVEVVRRLFDPDASRVVDVVCEVQPTGSLRDRTAFDAIVRYEATDGGRRFVGVETKYTEPFSATVYDTPRYREVTDSCGWFRPRAADALRSSATNQLWRGVMLAALVEAETGALGRYAVIAPADDSVAGSTVDTVARWLVDPARLSLVTLEQLVATTASIGDDELGRWAESFGRRYVSAVQ
jgi:hypothetical protein